MWKFINRLKDSPEFPIIDFGRLHEVHEEDFIASEIEKLNNMGGLDKQ
ncbi:MAG: hypothetical protein PHY54_08530 [Methylococcales bacterium]|nr:hypothetical protein [Methylococcales bacterium]